MPSCGLKLLWRHCGCGLRVRMTLPLVVNASGTSLCTCIDAGQQTQHPNMFRKL
jgi:hypothetical protein